MKTLPAGLAAHYAGKVHSLATCWLVEKSTGEIVRGTTHDCDIEIVTDTVGLAVSLAGIYRAQANINGSQIRSSADLSVDNMDVDGAFEDEARFDITVEEIESGVLDRARVIVFDCNWRAPNAGQDVKRSGYLGEISRDSDGKYTTEIRGLAQMFAQQIGSTYGESCNVVRFGDTRCGFDVAAIALSLTVASVTDRKNVSFTYAEGLAGAFSIPGGLLEFTSGDNDGFTREVKLYSQSGGAVHVELYDELPADAVIGDAATLSPGCNRTLPTCRDVYRNARRFRGFGVFIPGALSIMAGNAANLACDAPIEAVDESQDPDSAPPEDTPPPTYPDTLPPPVVEPGEDVPEGPPAAPGEFPRHFALGFESDETARAFGPAYRGYANVSPGTLGAWVDWVDFKSRPSYVEIYCAQVAWGTNELARGQYDFRAQHQLLADAAASSPSRQILFYMRWEAVPFQTAAQAFSEGWYPPYLNDRSGANVYGGALDILFGVEFGGTISCFNRPAVRQAYADMINAFANSLVPGSGIKVKDHPNCLGVSFVETSYNMRYPTQEAAGQEAWDNAYISQYRAFLSQARAAFPRKLVHSRANWGTQANMIALAQTCLTEAVGLGAGTDSMTEYTMMDDVLRGIRGGIDYRPKLPVLVYNESVGHINGGFSITASELIRLAKSPTDWAANYAIFGRSPGNPWVNSSKAQLQAAYVAQGTTMKTTVPTRYLELEA